MTGDYNDPGGLPAQVAAHLPCVSLFGTPISREHSAGSRRRRYHPAMSAPSIVRPLAVTGLLTVWALLSSLPASAWDIPPDNGTLPAAAVREILAADEYPVTTGYTQRIEFIDFVRNGRPFTQVAVILTPDTPRL